MAGKRDEFKVKPAPRPPKWPTGKKKPLEGFEERFPQKPKKRKTHGD